MKFDFVPLNSPIMLLELQNVLRMELWCSPIYLYTWNLSSGVSFIILIFLEKRYIASPSLKWMTNFHREVPSIKWITLMWGGYQGNFSFRSTWPRGLCLVNLLHPWGKLSTLLNPFYNPPGWPGSYPWGKPMTCALQVATTFDSLRLDRQSKLRRMRVTDQTSAVNTIL